MDFQDMGPLLQLMLNASLITLALFGLTILFSVPLGFLSAFGRMSRLKLIRLPVSFYLLIMRGTPLMLQVVFVYYGPFFLFGMRTSNEWRFWAAVVAFTLNYAAYFAEIFRSGIESIPAGQREASAVLGHTKSQTFFRVVLPQVVKRILPPSCSEFMTLIKDTALVQIIGVVELFGEANSAAATKGTIVPLAIAGLFYLVMNILVSFGFRLFEKRLSYYKNI